MDLRELPRLPGEDPTSARPEDAARWHAIYVELIRFKEHLIQQVESKIAASPELGPVLGVADLPFLERQADGFRRRARYWQGRISEHLD